jgi:hypothetical protein
MQYLRKALIVFGFIGTFLLGASEFAANMSTAFPPPPATTVSVPIVVTSCLR